MSGSDGALIASPAPEREFTVLKPNFPFTQTANPLVKRIPGWDGSVNDTVSEDRLHMSV